MKPSDTLPNRRPIAVKVSRIFSDPKHGDWLMLSGKRQMVEIRVTKSGQLRVGRAQKTTAPFCP